MIPKRMPSGDLKRPEGGYRFSDQIILKNK